MKGFLVLVAMVSSAVAMGYGDIGNAFNEVGRHFSSLNGPEGNFGFGSDGFQSQNNQRPGNTGFGSYGSQNDRFGMGNMQQRHPIFGSYGSKNSGFGVGNFHQQQQRPRGNAFGGFMNSRFGGSMYGNNGFDNMFGQNGFQKTGQSGAAPNRNTLGLGMMSGFGKFFNFGNRGNDGGYGQNPMSFGFGTNQGHFRNNAGQTGNSHVRNGGNNNVGRFGGNVGHTGAGNVGLSGSGNVGHSGSGNVGNYGKNVGMTNSFKSSRVRSSSSEGGYGNGGKGDFGGGFSNKNSGFGTLGLGSGGFKGMMTRNFNFGRRQMQFGY